MEVLESIGIYWNLLALRGPIQDGAIEVQLDTVVLNKMWTFKSPESLHSLKSSLSGWYMGIMMAPGTASLMNLGCMYARLSDLKGTFRNPSREALFNPLEHGPLISAGSL